jgi:hypothetical protein
MSTTASDAHAPKGKPLLAHGAIILPSVCVDSYGVALPHEKGLAGNKADAGAFVEFLDEVRGPLKAAGADPLGDTPSDRLSVRELDALLRKGEPQAAAVVESAVEALAQQLHKLICRFLKLKAWRNTEALLIGGGFRHTRMGELAIARAGILLTSSGQKIDLSPIDHDADEAGLIGAAHLLPAWMVEGYDAMLAVNVGAAGFVAGIVKLNLGKARDYSKVDVLCVRRWFHKQEKATSREGLISQLVKLLKELSHDAKKDGVALAPVVGVGCPGVVCGDGSIERGAQNLPGDWQHGSFNLPRTIQEHLPRLGDHETVLLMHNDVVVQGLSQIPRMRQLRHWGVLTIGSDFGNARFTNRKGPRTRL